MTKQEFLTELESALRRKKVSDVPEIIADYNEHFEAGSAMGKSEQQIIIELGAVESIANEYVENKEGAGYTQNFGNITNFFNQGINGGGGAESNEKKENRRPVKTAPEPAAEIRQHKPQEKPHYEQTEEETNKNNVGRVIAKILLGFVYFIAGIAVAATCFGIVVGFVAASVGLIIGGLTVTISSWFIFGAFLIKLSGFFAGLALIALGWFFAVLMKSLLFIVKSIYKFVTGLFKKALGGQKS